MFRIKRSIKVKKILLFIAVLLTIGSVALVNSYKKGFIMQSLMENPKATETIQRNIDISEDTNISSKYIDTSEYTPEYIAYMNMSEEEKQKVSIIPNKYNVSVDLFNDEYFKSLYNKKMNFMYASQEDSSDSNSETSFDIRDTIGELNVENQGTSNLCWAYSSNKTLEINIKLLDDESYDFSETYLDYITSNEVYGYNRDIGYGGHCAIAYDIMAIKGAATESVIPNGSTYSGDYTEIKNAECVKRVDQFINFPSIRKSDSTEYKELIKNYVKLHVENYGSVIASINAPAKQCGYSEENYAFCSNVDEYAFGHEVCIIGWDDNFSKDNFTMSGDNKPTNDGAWLAVNSWGTSWGDNGCFWISYEDPLVYLYMAGLYSCSDVNPYTPGFVINTYYPNENYTLKPGENFVPNGEGTYKVEFDRKTKDKEVLDYIAVICTGYASAFIATDNNDEQSFMQVGTKQQSYYVDAKDRFLFKPNADINLEQDKLLLKIEYEHLEVNNEDYGCGLFKADSIGGSTYRQTENEWEKTDYNIQVIVYTHSYEMKNIEIIENPKTNYNYGEELDLSTGKAKITYADNTSKIVPLSECIVSGYDANKEGMQNISVTYGSQKVSTSYSIEMAPIPLEKIDIKTMPKKLSYYVGEEIDLTGLELTGTKINGNTFDITEGFTCSPTKAMTEGTQKITITYEGKNTTFDVTVKNTVLERIDIKTMPKKLSYYVGDEIDLTGLELTGTNTNGSTFDITEGFTCSPTKLLSIGTNDVIVTYNEKTTSFKVTVLASTVDKIEVKSGPSKTEYILGESLNLSGLKLLVTYNNGKTEEITTGYNTNVEKLNNVGENTIIITYEGKQTNITVNVKSNNNEEKDPEENKNEEGNNTVTNEVNNNTTNEKDNNITNEELNNIKNNEIKDNTIAGGKLPQTGINKILIYILFLTCLLAGTIISIKYKKYRKIK